jgi:hypothetical protein
MEMANVNRCRQIKHHARGLHGLPLKLARLNLTQLKDALKISQESAQFIPSI